MVFRKNQTVNLKLRTRRFYGIKESRGKVKKFLSPKEPYDYIVVLKNGLEILVTRWDITNAKKR